MVLLELATKGRSYSRGVQDGILMSDKIPLSSPFFKLFEMWQLIKTSLGNLPSF